MSFADEVINGTFGKKKQKKSSFADEVIKGKYKSEFDFTPKKQEEEYVKENYMSPMRPINEIKKEESERKINSLRNERKELLQNNGIQTNQAGNPLLMNNYKDTKLNIGEKYQKQDNTSNYKKYEEKLKTDEEFRNKLDKNLKELNEEQKNNDILNGRTGTWFQKPKAFEDGYDFGDVTKTIAGSTADLGLNLVGGIWNVSEGLSDLLDYGKYAFYKKIGNEEKANYYKDLAKDEATNLTFKYIKDQLGIEKHSIFGEKSDNIGQGLGNVALIVSTAGIGEGLGMGQAGSSLLTTGINFSSSTGSGMSEAYRGGATDKEAQIYGLISGGAEAGTEMIFGGLGKSANALGVGKGLSSADDMLAKKVSNKLKSQLAKNLAEYTIKSGAEGTEEVISSVLQGLGKKLTYMSEEDLGKIMKDENLLDSFITGAITSGIAQTPGLIKNTKSGRDFITNFTQEEQTTFDNEVKRRINELQEDGKTLSKKQINNVESDLREKIEKGEVNIDALKAINDYEEQQGIKLSDFNKKYINAIAQAYQEEFNGTPTPATIIQDFKDIKEALITNFQKESSNIVQTMDENHQVLYRQLQNDVSQIIFDTGASVNFDINQEGLNSFNGDQIVINPTMTDMPIKDILTREIVRESIENKTSKYLLNNVKDSGMYEEYKNNLLSTGQFDEANVDMEIESQELERILQSEEELRKLKEKDIDLFNQIKNTFDILGNKLTKNRNTKDAYFINEVSNKLNNLSVLEKQSITNPKLNDLREKEPKVDNTTKIEEKPLEIDKNGATVDNKGKQLTVKQQEYEKQEVEEEKNKKILSPTEIANLKLEDANMTPELQKKKYNKKGDGESKQVKTLLKSNLFTDEQKQRIIADEEFRKYDKITNKESLDKAFEKLKENAQAETLRWFNNKENADAIDMAEGAILMKMYADNGMNDQMVEVAKKLRDMKTKTGQALQASSILSRMTPEGMVAYAQSELTEAYNELVKNKSQDWINENKDNFDLTPSDVDFIMETMEKVSKMEDGYDKKVELAKIQKLMSDKIPPSIGKKIKGWMRISMLFNPKTQVRNVGGNTIIAPVNIAGDLVSTVVDKAIAKKTGVRTTGTADIKSMLKGFKKGAYEAKNDFKLGINTKDMNGNRFEIGEGKSFSDKYAIGRGLNKVEHLLNYAMDVGDRVFYESWFENSLANQMALNKVDTPTQEMIDIATTEALQRTWNDNNKYTKFVLDIRKGINSVLGGEDYGLGDVLIPFAKTPANLTKAIVDYSPVGMVNALVQGNNLKKAISRGDMTPQQQHKFVQTLGKATAGTMLYILGYALAKTGVLTGKDDEDKDTKNFMKNVLGINQYSVKIGNTSFTYDWAQPISAPFAMMTNLVNSQNKETALLESVVASLDTAGSILLEQSFLQSINEVLTDNNGVVSGLLNAVLDLPARAIPTLFKQVADLADPVQRQTFEYGKPLQTAGEKMLVKIPGASKLLAPNVNNMGEDILKYGGKNNVFNVMFNPANVNKENVNEVGQEIYNVYKSTGKKDVMPRVAPYYINKKNGEKVQLSSSQIAEFQKMEGKEIEKNIKDIMNNSNYKNLSNEKKAELIKNIVNYAYNLTENKMFGVELSSSYKTVENVKEKGGDIGEYYLYKTQLGEKDSEYTKRKKLRLSNISKKTKSAIYEASVDNDNEKNTYNLYNVLKENDIDINEYLDYLSIEFKGDKDEDGQTISGSKKNKIIDYLNSSNLTYKQKLLIGGKQFTLDDEEQEYIIDLILKSKLSKSDKEKLIGSYQGIKIYSDGTARW